MTTLKRLELLGRRLLVAVAALLLGVRRHTLTLSETPRILVVRLDERLGNLLLLTPLLDSLRARFPLARIEVLVNARGVEIIGRHPAVDEAIAFRKRALAQPDGPLRTPVQLRARHYDLVIDAANPTDPSATQALLVRFAGARYTVGPTSAGFGRLYAAPVVIDPSELHEIDLRLQLLRPVPGSACVRAMSAPLFPVPAVGSALERWRKDLAKNRWGVLNVGARLTEKRLDAAAYARLGETMAQEGIAPVVTYGPSERELAREVVSRVATARLAPPTDVAQLAWIMRQACCVVSCDTGPMHLAVSLRTPTCGIFVSTDPRRYGHATPPHAVIDGRKSTVAAWRPELARWLAKLGVTP